MSNAFLELAERQIVAPVKARGRALEKRNRKLEESQRLFRHWQNKRLEQLLAGHHSEAARDLVHFLENMQPADEPALIQKIGRGAWRQADGDARFAALHLIDIAIARVREQQGLPPFDDPLPWLDDDPEPIFRIIKEMLA